MIRKIQMKPDVVANACNLSTGSRRQADLWEFKASLLYLENSRTAKVRYTEKPVLEKKILFSASLEPSRYLKLGMNSHRTYRVLSHVTCTTSLIQILRLYAPGNMGLL